MASKTVIRPITFHCSVAITRVVSSTTTALRMSQNTLGLIISRNVNLRHLFALSLELLKDSLIRQKPLSSAKAKWNISTYLYTLEPYNYVYRHKIRDGQIFACPWGQDD